MLSSLYLSVFMFVCRHHRR